MELKLFYYVIIAITCVIVHYIMNKCTYNLTNVDNNPLH